MRHRDLLRELDPLDPSASAPDDEALLASILASPYDRRAAPRRPAGRAFAAIPIVFVAALAVAVGLLTTSADERPAAGAAESTIVHYRIASTWSVRAGTGTSQDMGWTEVWQSSDGTRQRTLERTPDEHTAPNARGVAETLLTGSQSLTYIPASGQIIRYRADDDFSFQDDPSAALTPPDFSPAGLGGVGSPRAVGDPRELPDRAAGGDELVRALGDATVRDIPVRQFEVGDCTKPARTRRTGPNSTITDTPERSVVSLSRETGEPIRVEISACDPDADPVSPTRTLDYDFFEVLPATPENRELLEMAPHPGVQIVDGIDIDRAEERDERSGGLSREALVDPPARFFPPPRAP